MFHSLCLLLKHATAMALVTLLLMGVQSGPVVADIEAQNDANATSPATESTAEPTSEKTEQNDLEQKRAITVGTILLTAIVCAGLLLMLFIVVGGQRTRHLARKPLPKQTQGDDLWYLRPDKKSSENQTDDDADGDANTESDEADPS